MNIPQKRKGTAVAVILLLLAVTFVTACSAKPEPVNTEPVYQDYTETAESVPETEPPVKVEMPEYELTYSGELRDVIAVKRLEDQSALEFTVKLSQGEAHIFTLLYNTSEGELAMFLEDASGNRVPVAFRMATLPENLSEEDQATFFAAQEAVNEVAESLILK